MLLWCAGGCKRRQDLRCFRTAGVIIHMYIRQTSTPCRRKDINIEYAGTNTLASKGKFSSGPVVFVGTGLFRKQKFLMELMEKDIVKY